MKIKKQYMTKNPCYLAGRKILVKGLMLHSVGCPQPKASVFISLWNRIGHTTSCVHGFIDGETGMVYQTLPWNHRGWHCGSGINGSANNTHIGIELCEPAGIKYTRGSSFICTDKTEAKAVAKRTYEVAVELFAHLCTEYSLDPMKDGVILSHREAHARGVASNHGDPEHLWKGLGLPYSMNGFRKDVKEKMKGDADDQDDSAAKLPEPPFSVRVLGSDLKYRSAPSTEGKELGKTGKGVFTITEVKNGWGKLKSGAGWIYLGNPKECAVSKMV